MALMTVKSLEYPFLTTIA